MSPYKVSDVAVKQKDVSIACCLLYTHNLSKQIVMMYIDKSLRSFSPFV